MYDDQNGGASGGATPQHAHRRRGNWTRRQVRASKSARRVVEMRVPTAQKFEDVGGPAIWLDEVIRGRRQRSKACGRSASLPHSRARTPARRPTGNATARPGGMPSDTSPRWATGSTVGRFSFATGDHRRGHGRRPSRPRVAARVDIGRERELGNVGTTAHGVGVSDPRPTCARSVALGRPFAGDSRWSIKQRILQAGTGGGANLVGVEHLSDLFIEALTGRGAVIMDRSDDRVARARSRT